MSDVEVSRTVAAPVQRVWEVFTDLDHAADRLSGVERIEVLTPGRFKVGTTWRATRRTSGKPAVQQLTVTLCEPPERYLVEARHKGNHYRTEFLFISEDDTTTFVRMLFGTEPQGAGKVMDGMLGGLRDRTLAKTLQQDLDDLATAAEAAP